MTCKAAAFMVLRAVLLGLGLLLPCPASAAWPTDPLVNVPLCAASASDITVTCGIVADGEGGAIVLWWDLDPDSHQERYYAQRISADGVRLWKDGGVEVHDPAYATPGSNNPAAAIASDGKGGAIVCWVTYQDDLVAQRISAGGSLQWGVGGMPLSTAVLRAGVDVIADGAGGAIVTWLTSNGTGPALHAQRVSAAGTIQWGADGVRFCAAPGSRSDPTSAADGSGGAFIAWEDERAGLRQRDVYAQWISARGVPQWTADGVGVCTGTRRQGAIHVVADGAGGAIVAWDDYRGGPSGYDTYAQLVSADGTPRWTDNGVPVCTAMGWQFWSTLAADGSGGAIVTWMDERTGEWDIYAQRISAEGAPRWTGDGVPVCTAADRQGQPEVVGDGEGGAIIAWGDDRNGGDVFHRDIYAQRVSARGTSLWTPDGVPLCTSRGADRDPMIAPAGAGGAIVAWNDRRAQRFTYPYVQAVDRVGRLGLGCGTGDRTDAVAADPDAVPAAGDEGASCEFTWIAGGPADPAHKLDVVVAADEHMPGAYLPDGLDADVKALARAFASLPGIGEDVSQVTFWRYDLRVSQTSALEQMQEAMAKNQMDAIMVRVPGDACVTVLGKATMMPLFSLVGVDPEDDPTCMMHELGHVAFQLGDEYDDGPLGICPAKTPCSDRARSTANCSHPDATLPPTNTWQSEEECECARKIYSLGTKCHRFCWYEQDGQTRGAWRLGDSENPNLMRARKASEAHCLSNSGSTAVDGYGEAGGKRVHAILDGMR
jgi:hypothetical protein